MNLVDALSWGKILLAFVPLSLLAVIIYMERKGASLIQDRVGPNRAGVVFPGGLRLRLFGFVHNVSDGIKLFSKEPFIPAGAHRLLYLTAPMIPLAIGVISTAVLPWFGPVALEGAAGFVLVSGQILDADAGILLLFALSSLSVYGVVLSSWASNSKYPLLGGLRASAMMISYEVSMGLAAMGMFLLVGSFRLTEIVEWQATHAWGILVQPLGFVLFLTSLFAETGRAPFDVAEGDSEIVAGFFTEYSAVRFALFYMGEYGHVVLASAVCVTLFLGGYHLPFISGEELRQHVGVVGAGLLAATALVIGVIATQIHRWSRVLARGVSPDHRIRRIEAAWIARVLGVVSAAALIGGGGLLFLPEIRPVGMLDGRTVWPATVELGAAAVQFGTLVFKTLLVCWIFVWVRWTLPRLRYDQVMSLGWKVLLNAALLNLLATAVVARLVGGP